MITRTVDSRSIRRLGAQLWRDGHQSIEFFIPGNISRQRVMQIGTRLPFLRHRNRAIIIYSVVDVQSLGGTMIHAGYKRNRHGKYVEVYKSKVSVPAV